MAQPYYRNTQDSFIRRPNEWQTSTTQPYPYRRDHVYKYEGDGTGIAFLLGFVSVIVLIGLCSYLKSIWQEKRWAKQWAVTKEKEALAKREKSCEGINPFGYESGKKTTISINDIDKDRKYTPRGTPVTRRKNKALFIDELPTEVDFKVYDRRGSTVSIKTLHGNLQIQTLIQLLGLTIPEGFEIRITAKGVKADVSTDIKQT